MNARWLSAWGVFPRSSPEPGSICSDQSPTSLAPGTSASISAAASSRRPSQARASASQKPQATKQFSCEAWPL